jgi:probable HAF family extracellular repeat protein
MNSLTPSARAVLALLLLAPLGMRAQVAVTYIEALANTIDPGNLSYAHGINNSGVIVGMAVDSLGRSRAFSFTGASMTDLGTFGGSHAIAYGINNSGVIVGAAQDSSGNYEAFSYSGGSLSSMDPFGVTSAAHAINSTGFAVGYARDLSGVDVALRYPGLSVPTLGGVNGYAYGINGSGVIVGRAQDSGGVYQAFRHEGGSTFNIGPGLSTSSVAYDVNDSGDMVGTAFFSAAGVHAGFIRTASLDLIFLGLGGNNSYAYSINTHGDVVGYAQNISGQERAFIHTGGATYDLEALAQAAGLLVNFGDGIPGFISFRTNREFGISLNDNGGIAGYGQYYDGLVTVYNRAFYMQVAITSVPEPATYAALAGLGALGLALARRRLAAPKHRE